MTKENSYGPVTRSPPTKTTSGPSKPPNEEEEFSPRTKKLMAAFQRTFNAHKSDVKTDVLAAVAEGIRPVQTKIEAIKETQAEQTSTLSQHSSDIARLFELVKENRKQPSSQTAAVPSPGLRQAEMMSDSSSWSIAKLQAVPATSLDEQVHLAIGQGGESILEETSRLRSTVFLRQSNKAPSDYVLGCGKLEEMVSMFSPHPTYVWQSRGKAGFAVTFFAGDTQPGETGAAAFISFILQNYPDIWCTIDKPLLFRELCGRAYNFGADFKLFCAKNKF